jgi:hypothetical protein
MQDATDTSIGVSRDIGASDIVISLGGCQVPGGADCNLSAREQAGTLMHELGHNLGLRHGGGDDTNYKPTYISIMNYAFQFSWLRRTTSTPSRSTAAGRPAIYPLDAAAFDFNCDSAISPLVTADLNGDGKLTPLTGPVDWPRLVFNGGAIGSPATRPGRPPRALHAQASLQKGAPAGAPCAVRPHRDGARRWPVDHRRRARERQAGDEAHSRRPPCDADAEAAAARSTRARAPPSCVVDAHTACHERRRHERDDQAGPAARLSFERVGGL